MRTRTRRRRTGLVVWQLVLIVVVVIVLVVVLYQCAHRPTVGAAGGVVSGTAPLNTVPVIAGKPTPTEETFDGCPPEGDGRDSVLNRLKNRIDTAAYYTPVTVGAILDIGWPASIDRQARSNWSVIDRATVERREGLPVVVEGYLAGAKVEGPETPNCHGADPKYRDWHIWLTAAPGESRARSVVIETTPRVRAMHPTWELSALRAIVRDSTRVRVSGWLMLDPEHPDQVGKTRGTIWEIHPITAIEYQRRGRWSTL